MTEQPDALRLADALEGGEMFDVGSSGVAYGWMNPNNDPTGDAAFELRRLHAENEALRNKVAALEAAAAATGWHPSNVVAALAMIDWQRQEIERLRAALDRALDSGAQDGGARRSDA